MDKKKERCEVCGKALRSNARRRYTIRLADGRHPVHGACKHRFEMAGRCFCATCTGDIRTA